MTREDLEKQELDKLRKKEIRYYVKIIFQALKLIGFIWLGVALYFEANELNVSGKFLGLLLALHFLSKLKLKIKI